MHRGSNRNTWKSRSYGKISLAKRTQKQKYTKLPLGKPQKFDTTKKKHHVLTLVSCLTIPKRKKNLQLTAHWNLGAYQFPAYSAPQDHVLVMFHWATYLLSCWWQCHQALLTSSSFWRRFSACFEAWRSYTYRLELEERGHPQKKSEPRWFFLAIVEANWSQCLGISRCLASIGYRIQHVFWSDNMLAAHKSWVPKWIDC